MNRFDNSGEIADPCGVPRSRFCRVPSTSCIGAVSHRLTYSRTHGSSVCSPPRPVWVHAERGRSGRDRPWRAMGTRVKRRRRGWRGSGGRLPPRGGARALRAADPVETYGASTAGSAVMSSTPPLVNDLRATLVRSTIRLLADDVLGPSVARMSRADVVAAALSFSACSMGVESIAQSFHCGRRRRTDTVHSMDPWLCNTVSRLLGRLPRRRRAQWPRHRPSTAFSGPFRLVASLARFSRPCPTRPPRPGQPGPCRGTRPVP